MYAIRKEIATKQFIKALCEKSFSCLCHTFSTRRLLKTRGLTMVEKRIFSVTKGKFLIISKCFYSSIYLII